MSQYVAVWHALDRSSSVTMYYFKSHVMDFVPGVFVSQIMDGYFKPHVMDFVPSGLESLCLSNNSYYLVYLGLGQH